MTVPVYTRVFNQRDLGSQSQNIGTKSLDGFGVAGIVIGVVTAIAAILALFKGWKCWKGRRSSVNPLINHWLCLRTIFLLLDLSLHVPDCTSRLIFSVHAGY